MPEPTRETNEEEHPPGRACDLGPGGDSPLAARPPNSMVAMGAEVSGATRYGRWRPLADNWAEQSRLNRYDLVIVHTMVGTLWGTDNYFREGNGYGGTESHFGVGFDAETLQWQDTRYRADANGVANSRAISVETADLGEGFPRWDTDNGEAVPAWTDAQVDRLVDLLAWCCRAHDIPAVLVPDSRPHRRGIAYHRLGVPGHAVPGGELWSTARYKSCPGPARIRQLPGIVDRVAARLNQRAPGPGQEHDMTPAQEARLERVERAAELIVQQMCGHAATIEKPFPGVTAGGGWPTTRYGTAQERLTPVMFLQRIDQKLSSALGLADRPGRDPDDMFGQVLSIRAELRALTAHVTGRK